MLYWGAVVLVIALLVAPLGFAGAAGMSMNTAWIPFFIGLICAVGFFVIERWHGI